jgi:hypothetical protein
MAAQFEELGSRTTDQEEFSRLQALARKCRILSGEMSQATLSTAA